MLTATQSREAAKVIKANLTKAFKNLRRGGYVCKQNFFCCQSCGRAAITADKVIFYHAQDNESLLERGEVWLAWSGDGAHIVEVLEQHGLDCEWDGDDANRILVRLP